MFGDINSYLVTVSSASASSKDPKKQDAIINQINRYIVKQSGQKNQEPSQHLKYIIDFLNQLIQMLEEMKSSEIETKKIEDELIARNK